MYFFLVGAVVGAAYFSVMAIRQPRPGMFVAALVWLLYAVYEYFIANETLCDANCNIRVDLLLIWPLLLCASLFGIYGPGQWTRTGKVICGVSLFLVAAMGAIAFYIALVETPAARKAALPAGTSTTGSPAPGSAATQK